MLMKLRWTALTHDYDSIYESLLVIEIRQDNKNNVFTKNAIQYNTVILQGWVEYSWVMSASLLSVSWWLYPGVQLLIHPQFLFEINYHVTMNFSKTYFWSTFKLIENSLLMYFKLMKVDQKWVFDQFESESKVGFRCRGESGRSNWMKVDGLGWKRTESGRSKTTENERSKPWKWAV